MWVMMLVVRCWLLWVVLLVVCLLVVGVWIRVLCNVVDRLLVYSVFMLFIVM